MQRNGFIYVATGAKYRNQASISIEFLQRTNPEVPVTLFTDAKEGLNRIEKYLDKIIIIPKPQFSFVDKIEGFLSTLYEKNVFLDCDTITADRISQLFTLLDRFDFAACHAPGHSGARYHHYESPDLPSSFVQFYTGVVCFRAVQEVRKVFAAWRELYLASPEHIHDQPSLRAVLYQSNLKLYALPPEYNFLFGPAYFSGPVKILTWFACFEES